MRNKLNLAMLKFRRLIIFDSTIQYTLNDYSKELKICDCHALREKYGQAQTDLSIIAGNPTKSRRKINTSFIDLMDFSGIGAARVMIAENHGGEQFTQQVRASIMKKFTMLQDLKVLSLGKLRGSNIANQCNIAVLASAGLFPGVQLSMLKAALVNGRTIKASEIWAADGNLKMRNGVFQCVDLQNIFMCDCVSEIYQGLWRTALRNNGEVTAIIAIPHAVWLGELDQLMKFVVRTAYGDPRKCRRMIGMGKLLQVPYGQFISKESAARTLGYSNYKHNRVAVKSYMATAFKDKYNKFERIRPNSI